MTHFNAFLLLAGNIFGDLCDTRREIIYGAGMGSLHQKGL